MKLAAYVLAADPAWLAESVLSYYEHVDTIVVSFDENHTSWTGTPIPVQQCLDALQALDRDGKLVLAPGHFARLDHHPLENETFQRQHAIEVAGKDADWIIQLDSDEVFGDWDVFHSSLEQAAAEGFDALDFPARSLFQRFAVDRYLELVRRGWRVAAGYPGSMAIKSGTVLTHCRQAGHNTVFRVDYAKRTTDPVRAKDTPIHRVIDGTQGIWHFSWIRDVELMERKAKWSGHTNQRDWGREIQQWKWAARHPYLATAWSPTRDFTLRRGVMWLRPVTVPVPRSTLG